MTKRIILHVGMHKTGTTALQMDVFPKLPDVYYAKDDVFTDLVGRIILENLIHIDIEHERRVLDEFMATIPQETILISHEGLFGHHHNSYQNNRGITILLHQLFPGAKVFMSFRRQDEWFESLYHQTLHQGSSFSVKRFLNYKDGQFQPFRPEYCQDGTVDVRLNAYPFVRHYQQCFGEENVLVLPYELMKVDMKAYLDRFYEFFNIEPFYPKREKVRNRSYSMVSSYIALWMNPMIRNPECQQQFKKFLKKSVDQFIPYVPAKFIREKERTELMALHEEKNRQLSELIGVDLKPYGYYQ